MKNKKSCSCLNRLVNINYSSKAKFLLLIPVIIIALAVMITSIFGLNFARDLQVKYEMNIDFVAELEEDKIIEYQDKIADALAEQNLQINDIRKSGKNNIYTGFAITIDYSEDFTEEEIADLQEAIELY